MRYATIAIASVLILMVSIGCSRTPETDAKPKATSTTPGNQPNANANNNPKPGGGSKVVAQGGGGGVGAIRRVIDRAEVQGQLKQLGIFLQQHVALNGSAPKTKQEFTEIFKRDAPKIYKMFEDNYYGYVPVGRPNSNTIVVYEMSADNAGNHLVLKGDGSVSSITTGQLRQSIPNSK